MLDFCEKMGSENASVLEVEDAKMSGQYCPLGRRVCLLQMCQVRCARSNSMTSDVNHSGATECDANDAVTILACLVKESRK